jgi:hypothetical protein
MPTITNVQKPIRIPDSPTMQRVAKGVGVVIGVLLLLATVLGLIALVAFLAHLITHVW